MKRIPLTRGLFALVDDADFESLNQFKWYAHKDRNTYYACRAVGGRANRKRLSMHRNILGLKPGDGLSTDHANHDGLDNRRCNLRICTCSQNSANSISRTGSSKYKGVCWYKRYKRWGARITLHYKLHHLGCFKDETEAAKAYNKAAIKYFREFAHLNVIGSEVA